MAARKIAEQIKLQTCDRRVNFIVAARLHALDPLHAVWQVNKTYTNRMVVVA